MTQESVLVVCDAAVHSLSMSSREWKILHVRPFAEAQQFIHALGLYANFTVAAGTPEVSAVTVPPGIYRRWPRRC